MDTNTISISIGDARFSTCLVLPRSHELVRHIQSLLPANALAQQPPQDHTSYSSRADYRPPRAASSSSHSTRSLHDSSPPGRPDPHRSAAVIQSLLHRPASPPSSVSSIDSGWRRGASSSSSRKKRCQVDGCDKISVSQGLCRAHGGGRRCAVDGCAKSAQSRGDYCWSHGGGHRCEVPGCMRSRKTKRFCNIHVNCGSDATQSFPRRRVAAAAAAAPPASVPVQATYVDPSPSHARPAEPATSLPRLPSLHHALQPFPREPSPLRGFLGDRGGLGASPSFSC